MSVCLCARMVRVCWCVVRRVYVYVCVNACAIECVRDHIYIALLFVEVNAKIHCMHHCPFPIIIIIIRIIRHKRLLY